MTAPFSLNSRSRQRGAALLVAVVFLLLAGIMTLFALNVGMFETRSTANDVRAKTVNEVAEAGLSQGFEYLMRQQADMLEDSTLWRLCGANEVQYPCGAVLGTVDHDRNPATAEIARRSTMWRLINSGYNNANFDAAMTAAMLKLPNPVPSVGGFDVTYGVAPVVCFVERRELGEANTDPIRCATNVANASKRRIATFVSVARMVGEGARATLTQTVGRFALVDDPIGQPPVMASGMVNVSGGLQLVTNPNSGGAGVPVSVWTRKNVDKTGTSNTCYADEFFRYGAKNNSEPVVYKGDLVSTILCDDCQCEGDKSLSYDHSGNDTCKDNKAICEGIDILDVEGSSAQRGDGVNHNVQSDALSYAKGICEFPPDVFGHVFGVQAWVDVNPGDCFAETKVMQDYTNPNNGEVIKMGADEAFLYSYAAKIVYPTDQGKPIISNDQTWAPGGSTSSLSGLVWCQACTGEELKGTWGSPDRPVILVIDAPSKITIHGKIYGLVVVRSTAGGSTLTPAAGYVMTAAEQSAGGSAKLVMNASAIIYGALVVQGEIEHANGTSAVVHDSNILQAIGKNADGNKYATLPGAWNDSFSY